MPAIVRAVIRAGAAVAMAAAAATLGCASAPPPVTKIVNGNIVVTRAISPDAYEHVARALLYEEEQRWEDAAGELQRALSFDDQAAEVRAHLADVFLQLGRTDDAADQAARSLEIAPTVDGYLAMAHVAEARHDEKAALGRYREAASLAIGDGDVETIERTHLALATSQLGALDVTGAYATVRTLADAAHDSVRARVELGALAWALGRLPESEAALNEALELEPGEVDARLMLAALRVATGRTAEAKTAFRETLERAEDSIEIAEMFLKWLVARGDRAEAAAEADRLTPDIADEGTVETIIRVERAAGQVDRAKAAAERAVQKGTPAPRVTLLVAGALADAKDYAGAAARLLKVPRGATEFIDSRLRAAEALREAGGAAALDKADGALREVETAIAAAAAAADANAHGKADAGKATAVPAPAKGMTGTAATSATTAAVKVASGATGDGATGTASPRDFTTDFAVARALLEEKRGDPARGVRGLDAALEKDPDNIRLLLVRAAIDERRGEWRKALAAAQTILDRDPRNVEALNFHGFVSADHDHDLPTAARRLQVAMVLDPGAGGIVDSLGWAYLRAGDLARANELLIEADRLEPGDPEILAHVAELYVRQKQVDRAVATYRQALEHAPTEKLRREIEGHLRALEAKTAAGR